MARGSYLRAGASVSRDQEALHELRDVPGLDERCGGLGAAEAGDRILEGVSPRVLDEDGGNRVTWPEHLCDLMNGIGGRAFQRSARRDRAFSLVQAKAEQLREHPTGRAAPKGHRGELAGFGLTPQEERIQDPHGAAALDALEGADQLPFEPRFGTKPVRQELP
jgi:hypothetical protein